MNPSNLFVHLSEENFQTITTFLKTLKTKCPNIHIIAGGIPATLSGEKLLKQHPEIDWIIAGERDLTLLELLQKLEKNQNLTDVQGLSSLQFHNKPRPLISNLDLLGDMIHDEIDELVGSSKEKDKVGYLLSSRGCYARCSFCGIPSYYGSSENTWRGRSVSMVVNEIESLSVKFGINHFVFEDDNFFGPGPAGQERGINIAREIIDRKLNIRFFFCCRVNDIQKDSLSALKTAGLYGIGIGIESTCPDSLKLFKKGFSKEQIYHALELLDELKIKVEINMIFFDPYLTLEGVRSNLALFEFIRNKELFFYSSSFPFVELKPFPWSPIAKKLKEEVLLNDIDHTCFYKDPKVNILAEWTRNLRRQIPPLFKRRQIFYDSKRKGYIENSLEHSQSNILTPAVRYWVGMYVLPRYLRLACDLVEKNESNLHEQLASLERKLVEEIAPMDHLQRMLNGE